METMRGLVVVSLITLLTTGCVMSGRNIDEKQVGQIVEGQTTRSQLIAMFGEPQSKIRKSGYEMLYWSYFNSGFLAASEQSKGLRVLVDEDGTVKKYQAINSNTKSALAQSDI
ncbi:hypothetical protein EAW52_15650 [Pseudomonas sp. LTJR-52]|nr:hypothetical protein EAW52_15650 [Pseudomonas sp. LTJR-52]